MTPLNAPWSTFLAWIVAALTVIVSIVWAASGGGRTGDD